MEPDIPSLSPSYDGSVWPPPPTNQALLPQAQTYPFKTLLNYVQGSVTNFRVGTVTLYPEGATIQGKAVIRYEIQVPILIVCLLLRLGFLVAYAIMEYGLRRDEMVNVPWSDVRLLVLSSKKQRACLVYDAPNYKQVVKTFSLAFKLEPALYDRFVASVRQSIPERVQEGKLRAWTSPPVWVFCGGALVGLAILLIVFLMTGHGAGTP